MQTKHSKIIQEYPMQNSIDYIWKDVPEFSLLYDPANNTCSIVRTYDELAVAVHIEERIKSECPQAAHVISRNGNKIILQAAQKHGDQGVYISRHGEIGIYFSKEGQGKKHIPEILGLLAFKLLNQPSDTNLYFYPEVSCHLTVGKVINHLSKRFPENEPPQFFTEFDRNLWAALTILRSNDYQMNFKMHILYLLNMNNDYKFNPDAVSLNSKTDIRPHEEVLIAERSREYASKNAYNPEKQATFILEAIKKQVVYTPPKPANPAFTSYPIKDKDGNILPGVCMAFNGDNNTCYFERYFENENEATKEAKVIPDEFKGIIEQQGNKIVLKSSNGQFGAYISKDGGIAINFFSPEEAKQDASKVALYRSYICEMLFNFKNVAIANQPNRPQAIYFNSSAFPQYEQDRAVKLVVNTQDKEKIDQLVKKASSDLSVGLKAFNRENYNAHAALEWMMDPTKNTEQKAVILYRFINNIFPLHDIKLGKKLLNATEVDFLEKFKNVQFPTDEISQRSEVLFEEADIAKKQATVEAKKPVLTAEAVINQCTIKMAEICATVTTSDYDKTALKILETNNYPGDWKMGIIWALVLNQSPFERNSFSQALNTMKSGVEWPKDHKNVQLMGDLIENVHAIIMEEEARKFVQKPVTVEPTPAQIVEKVLNTITIKYVDGLKSTDIDTFVAFNILKDESVSDDLKMCIVAAMFYKEHGFKDEHLQVFLQLTLYSDDLKIVERYKSRPSTDGNIISMHQSMDDLKKKLASPAPDAPAPTEVTAAIQPVKAETPQPKAAAAALFLATSQEYAKQSDLKSKCIALMKERCSSSECTDLDRAVLKIISDETLTVSTKNRVILALANEEPPFNQIKNTADLMRSEMVGPYRKTLEINKDDPLTELIQKELDSMNQQREAAEAAKVKAKATAEAKVKLEAEQKARAEAQAKAEVEAKAKAEAEKAPERLLTALSSVVDTYIQHQMQQTHPKTNMIAGCKVMTSADNSIEERMRTLSMIMQKSAPFTEDIHFSESLQSFVTSEAGVEKQQIMLGYTYDPPNLKEIISEAIRSVSDEVSKKEAVVTAIDPEAVLQKCLTAMKDPAFDFTAQRPESITQPAIDALQGKLLTLPQKMRLLFGFVMYEIPLIKQHDRNFGQKIEEVLSPIELTCMKGYENEVSLGEVLGLFMPAAPKETETFEQSSMRSSLDTSPVPTIVSPPAQQPHFVTPVYTAFAPSLQQYGQLNIMYQNPFGNPAAPNPFIFGQAGYVPPMGSFTPPWNMSPTATAMDAATQNQPISPRITEEAERALENKKRVAEEARRKAAQAQLQAEAQKLIEEAKQIQREDAAKNAARAQQSSGRADRSLLPPSDSFEDIDAEFVTVGKIKDSELNIGNNQFGFYQSNAKDKDKDFNVICIESGIKTVLQVIDTYLAHNTNKQHKGVTRAESYKKMLQPGNLSLGYQALVVHSLLNPAAKGSGLLDRKKGELCTAINKKLGGQPTVTKAIADKVRAFISETFDIDQKSSKLNGKIQSFEDKIIDAAYEGTFQNAQKIMDYDIANLYEPSQYIPRK